MLALVAVGAALIGLLVWHRAPKPIALDAPLAAHLTGLLAGYGITVMLALMSRAPALERGVGADQLARLHASGGRVIVLLTAVHAVAATVAWGRARRVNPVMATWEVLGFPGLLAATAGTVLLFAVAFASARAARRKLSYERWHALHLATYVAVALAFSHQLAGPDIAGYRWVQVIWSLLYTYAFGLIIRYRVLTPLHQMLRHRMRLIAVVPEADGVVSLILRGRHLAEMTAEPGQFLRWRFLTAGTWHSAHPFSLSAPATDEHLRITVKALGEGTRRIHALRPGTRVLAEGPYGAMTSRRRTQPHVLLVAGGIGITPMRALFETIDAPGNSLTLIYRAPSPADIVFGHELAQIARHRGARLIYLVGPSSDSRNAVTASALTAMVPQLQRHDVYLCAGDRFAAAVRRGLADAGLPARQLHHELFSF
ncbi:MAG: ferric reductase [Pseudonocardiales bacterium]|nr:ferric reductase [Jatrophihabitantaceae bacterium]MCW2602394.1 ferric reductase [Pseudonocardiales bacterium]